MATTSNNQLANSDWHLIIPTEDIFPTGIQHQVGKSYCQWNNVIHSLMDQPGRIPMSRAFTVQGNNTLNPLDQQLFTIKKYSITTFLVYLSKNKEAER